VYFCPCDFLQDAAFGKSLSKSFASPADLRLALALGNVLEIRASECTGKKASVTGGDGFVPAKHCFIEATRGRGRLRPFLESTLGCCKKSIFSVEPFYQTQ
jgi:hypothetical protein